jgi:DNA-binding transcriptional LysR family regulator
MGLIDERVRLEVPARSYSSPYQYVVRAKIVLLAAGGPSNGIAVRLLIPRQIVSKWRKRFHNRVQELSDSQTIAQLVAAGVGVSLRIGDPKLLRCFGVVYRAVDDPGPAGISPSRGSGERSPVVEALFGAVEDEAKNLSP